MPTLIAQQRRAIFAESAFALPTGGHRGLASPQPLRVSWIHHRSHSGGRHRVRHTSEAHIPDFREDRVPTNVITVNPKVRFQGMYSVESVMIETTSIDAIVRTHGIPRPWQL